MRVIATARGFDNTATREPGEEFDIDVNPDVFKDPKTKPTWFVPVRVVRAAKEQAPAQDRKQD